MSLTFFELNILHICSRLGAEQQLSRMMFHYGRKNGLIPSVPSILKSIINHKVATEKIRTPTFRALALRQSESENSSERCYLYRET